MAELYYFGEKVSPQYYIRNMILSNDGVRTYVRVSDMHNLLDKLSLPYSKNDTRNDLLNILLENSYDWQFIAKEFKIGVNVKAYTDAFDFLSNGDIKRFEKFGLLKVVGHQCFCAYGRKCYVSLYDLYQFLDLSEADMRKMLIDCPKGKRTKVGEK